MAGGDATRGWAARSRRIFQEEQDLRLAQAAVERGFVEASQLAAARAAWEAAPDDARLTDRLVALGLLTADQLERLRASVAREAYAEPPPRAAQVPPEVAAVAGDPARQIGDFVLVARLGRGGAGEVWRAWDRHLERWVAVKLAGGAELGPGARERFEREARAAARLAHPAIVPLHSTGVHDGRPYLVMPLIEGRSLEGATLPARRALEVVRDAARAVEAAHRQGVVHRDLKPANLMLDDAGRVFVLDFGLASLREEEARLTAPGDVLGTAAYMAPEQARGGGAAIGPHTDVYGLGATLFHLLTGESPYRGASFGEIVAQVASATPSPRARAARPDVPAAVEDVVARAMAKDPARRYPDAAALADDIERLLGGQRPQAPPAGRSERRRRWRRGAAAAAALLGGGMIAALFARSVHRERVAVEGMREVARGALGVALELRRSGDVAGMRRLLPAIERTYEQATARSPRAGEIDYLMGRVYRAVLDEDRALAAQDRALAKAPAYAPALYERAVLLSQRYGRLADLAVARARVLRGGAQVDQRRVVDGTPALAALRADVMRDLTRLQALRAAEVDAVVARGILAFYQGDHARSRDLLLSVAERAPERDELWLTLARAETALGQALRAEATYTRALAHDPGFVPLLLARCDLRARNHLFDGATADASHVLAVLPESPQARLCRATAALYRGHDAMMEGRDPTADFDAAEADYGFVLAREPDRVEAVIERGCVRRHRATFDLRRGRPAEAGLAASDADLSRAVATAPGSPVAWAQRARTRSLRVFARLAAGQDATAEIAAAQADFAEAARLDPGRGETRDWRGDLQAHLGRAEARAGRFAAAEAAFAAAEADFTAMLGPRGGHAWSHLHRGTMRTWRGEARVSAGGDPAADWTGAAADLDRAVALLPAIPEVWARRAQLRAAQAASLRRRQPAAARAAAAAAAADLARARALDAPFVARALAE